MSYSGDRIANLEGFPKITQFLHRLIWNLQNNDAFVGCNLKTVYGCRIGSVNLRHRGKRNP